jgi:Flp pilus assembly protein TadG
MDASTVRSRALAFLRRLMTDRDGTVAVLLALSLVALVGMLALGIEGNLWFSARRSLQTAADAAALSGAYEIYHGQTDYVSAATIDAGKNGYNAANNTTITVNNPPATGAYTGDNHAVEVILSQPQKLLLAQVISGGASTLTVTARAVATQATATGSGTYCVLGLDTTAPDTVLLSQNATAPNANCGIASNSTSSTGLELYNNASIAGPVAVAGSGVSTRNNAEIDGEISDGAVTIDPYSNVDPGTPGACETGQTVSGKNNMTVNLTPGHFCTGLNFMNNVTINMAPGIYYIDSQFVLQNNAILNATGGVSIVFNGNFAMDVNNNATLNITAPTSGPLAGIAMMGPRDSSPSVDQVFSNNSILNIGGAIYFPSQKVSLENNANTSSNGCTQLIADQVYLSNNANLPSNCSGSGTTPINQTIKVMLVE